MYAASKFVKQTQLLRNAAKLKLPCLWNPKSNLQVREHEPLPYIIRNHVLYTTQVQPCPQECSASSPNARENKDDVYQKVADIIGHGPWSPVTEKALEAFIPIPIPTVYTHMMQTNVSEECMMRFLSWASKQPGCLCCKDDVEQIAQLWVDKYGSEKLASIQQTVISIGVSSEPVWAALMVANSKLRRPSESVTVFMEMKKAGCQPSQLTYEPLLFALVKSNRVDAAMFTCQEMMASGIRPADQALGILFDGLCRSGKGEAALSFIHELGRTGPSSYVEHAYSRFITAVWRTRSSSMALEVLHDMKTKGLKPDRHAYTVCVKLLCKNQRFDMAQQLVKDMKDQNCAPDMLTYTSLINGLSRGGRVTEALEIADIMRKQGGHLDSRMYTAILNCLFMAGKVNDAIQTFENMRSEGHVADLVTYFVMIKNLCEAGRVSLALDIKKDMSEKGFLPDAKLYLALTRALCIGSTYVKELLVLVEEMRSKGYEPSAEVYLTLITHFCTQGNFEQARGWAKEMINKGHQPTPYIRTKFSTELGDILGS